MRKLCHRQPHWILLTVLQMLQAIMGAAQVLGHTVPQVDQCTSAPVPQVSRCPRWTSALGAPMPQVNQCPRWTGAPCEPVHWCPRWTSAPCEPVPWCPKVYWCTMWTSAPVPHAGELVFQVNQCPRWTKHTHTVHESNANHATGDPWSMHHPECAGLGTQHPKSCHIWR